MGDFLFFGFEFINSIQTDLVTRFDELLANLPAWLGFLQYAVIALAFLLRTLLIVIALIVTGFTLTQFGVLLGAPWYGQLSEQLEKIRTGKLKIVEVSLVWDLSRAILYELKKVSFNCYCRSSFGYY